MPLKLSDANAPAATNILNKWADSQEQTQNSTTAQLTTLRATNQKLQSQLTAVQANLTTVINTAAASAVTGVIQVPGGTITSGHSNQFDTQIACNATDILTFSEKNRTIAAVYLTWLTTELIGSTYHLIVQTNIIFGVGTTYPSYTINYKIN